MNFLNLLEKQLECLFKPLQFLLLVLILKAGAGNKSRLLEAKSDIEREEWVLPQKWTNTYHCPGNKNTGLQQAGSAAQPDFKILSK